MFYVFSVTVPHSTPQSSPLVTDLELGPGEITQVEVGFAWGAAGLAHVQIWLAEHQVWPTNAGASFAWNDYNHVFPESEPCAGPGEHWSIRCWNLDDTFDHTIQVRLSILAVEKTMLGKIAESLFGGGR